MFVRSAPHEIEYRLSSRARADRMRHRPKSLLAWAASEYWLEAPAKLHSGAVLSEDGHPAMTGEAAGYIGFHQGEDGGQPNDWLKVACCVDRDGKYKTPLRCSLARIADPKRRRFAAELATNIYYPLEVAEANGITGPKWTVQAAIDATLELVWRTWQDAPEPRSRGYSESQHNAEEAAIECAHRWEQVPASAAYVEAGFPVNRCKRCGVWSQEVEVVA